ncbi:MAG: methionine synthase [Chloroflexota bacterium]|nr:methionine synthase [Chloroflexota bacterium]
MYHYHNMPTLPTQVIGSYGTPGWLYVVRDSMKAGHLGGIDIREAFDDATNVAIMEMEEAGVDVISDGEMRRFNFLVGFYDSIHGVEKLAWERQLGYPGPDMIDAFRATDRFAAPDGFGLVHELQYARTRTQKPLVTPFGGPVTFAFRINPGTVYKDKREVAWALVPLLNKELRDVVAAGATHIQIDEPSAIDDFVSVDEFVEMFNAMVEGVTDKATIGLHICFGNYMGRPAVAHRTYEYVAPIFPKLHTDIIHLEFANRGMWQADLFSKFARDDQMLAAGVIDVKARAIETPQVVAERIREILKYTDPKRVWVSADCGFSMTARWVGREKLKAMVEGTKIVRAELGVL